MIASSITTPTISVNASIVIWLSVYPIPLISAKVAMIDVGIAMAAMMVVRMLARKKKMTSAARKLPATRCSSSERTAASAYTNTARYIVRPIAPLVAGSLLQTSVGAPFVVAGVLKSLYDLGLYVLFRNVKVSDEA